MTCGNRHVLLAITHISDRIGVNPAAVSKCHSSCPLPASRAKKEVRFEPKTSPPPVVIRPECDGRCSLYSQRSLPRRYFERAHGAIRFLVLILALTAAVEKRARLDTPLRPCDRWPPSSFTLT